MREPRAMPIRPTAPAEAPRSPRAFNAAIVEEAPDVFEATPAELADTDIAPAPKRLGRFWRNLALWTGGTLISLGLGLAADRLIRDLFAAYSWLGWVGLAALAVFVLALTVLVFRELIGLARLRTLDKLRDRASSALLADDLAAAQKIEAELQSIYSTRADLARARDNLATDAKSILDGAELIKTAERALMAPLDARARALTASSARRVALVTAVAPRALIDIAFVIFESFRLARNIADLYGARPGLFGFFRLVGAILAHLAVTGGLVLTDGVVEQLVGHGVAAKLSARLGEGVLNGLMTVRVGIAAMKVVRPLPFATQKSPVVSDFLPDLVKLAADPKQR
ncbi:YcjF family protein [Pelagibacterium luteolum]|uniref:Putative membrane protein n=1 Tax=Pelagibacterium luteolum TaxID=440168 RepID=A0A1G7UFE3_9HYPH|nr:TIGR01620 family protein [Pelagibacterium luteolum]SDG45779.1 putative membrane protein [Pelagibacterium luteolum]